MAEEYYQIPENPQYDPEHIRKLKNSDPASAEQIFNPLIQRILENIAAVQTAIDELARRGADLYAMLDALAPPEMHRNVYGGRDLGNHVTDAQLAAIKDGSFKGLFVGDYWAIDGANWRIADMDYFYRTGDTEFDKHHLVIVPEKNLYSAKMNDSNITTGGYMGSKMYTEYINRAKTTISSAFGELVLPHKDNLINAVTDGHPSGYAWVESTVELMNEIMVYGTMVFAAGNNDGSTVPVLYTTGKQQFALFALNPKMVSVREASYWLRDVVSSAKFASVHAYGRADSYDASYSIGVRPYFCVG